MLYCTKRNSLYIHGDILWVLFPSIHASRAQTSFEHQNEMNVVTIVVYLDYCFLK